TEGFHRRRPTITKDVNYDVYAKAEAELGWFNGMYTINSNLPMNVVAVMEGLLKEINRRVRECKGEIAHAKTRFSTRNGWVKASLVISDESIGITGEVPPPSKDIDVILNIRASIDPVALKSIVKGSLEIVTANYSARYKEWSSSSFRPGYPKPYYRLVHT
ncbi:MAG: hypothetical protein QXF24_04635, partial [Thermoproteota archaeon]